MKRNAYNLLKQWKNNPRRKPLVVFGARQVGKTWLVQAFGKNEYSQVAYINCDNNPLLQNPFNDYDTQRIIRLFSAISDIHITAENTLIILDEIQETPNAITALKYFYENAPQYHIIVSGSLLGLSVHQGTGYPVGKVDELKIYPMSFKEFLYAKNKEILIEQMENHLWQEINLQRHIYQELLREYYFTGGMPEVVQYYIDTQDLQGTRKIQQRILQDYEQDFSKHIPSSLLAKVRLVFNHIPAQLAKENKKFIYGAIKKGSRAKEFEDAINWLCNAGLVHKINRVSKIAMPLKYYEEMENFKLFMHDLGLLGAMSNVPIKQIIAEENIFSEYKGSFTEQFVAQQMIATNNQPYYYTSKNSDMEIDFVLQQEENVYPIEVKAQENLKSKSLKSVIDKNPQLHGWRFSMSNFRKQDYLTNIPLYLIEEWLIHSGCLKSI